MCLYTYLYIYVYVYYLCIFSPQVPDTRTRLNAIVTKPRSCSVTWACATTRRDGVTIISTARMNLTSSMAVVCHSDNIVAALAYIDTIVGIAVERFMVYYGYVSKRPVFVIDLSLKQCNLTPNIDLPVAL